MSREQTNEAADFTELGALGVRPGEMISDKFRLEEVVGSGGMGVVFKAWHLELEEHVALKFLLPSRAGDPELRGRFALEARAAAKLRSKHTVRVHDVGVLHGKLPFIVMEYLRGRTVGEILKERGSLPIELACELAIQTCEALAEAHARGIVHRDVKPENLVVTMDQDDSPLLCVVDFGISKVALALDPGRTNPGGTVLGTPYYMSPEQIDGCETDGRSDLWSLGAVLFEMVSGRKPFGGATFASLASEILAGPPRKLRKVRFDAPEELEAIIEKCLAKSPADRFASVGELAKALEPFAPVESGAVAERARRIGASASGVKSERPSGPSLDAVIVSSGKMRARQGVESPWRYVVDGADVAAPGQSVPPRSGSRPSTSPPSSDNLAETVAGARLGFVIATEARRRALLLAAILAALVVAWIVARVSGL